MTNIKPAYFFPPQWHYQTGGPIALGSIISDAKEPQRALNYEPDGVTNRPALPRLTANTSEPQFETTISANVSHSVNIDTSLLQIFGFGVGLKVERKKKRIYRIQTQNLLIQEFDPKSTYVEQCFQHAEVQRYLHDTKFRKDLYMIIGVMSATSATVSTDIGRSYLFGGNVGVDLTIPTGGAAPVAINLGGEQGRGKFQTGSFGKSDFILGYRLRKITFIKTMRVKRMEDVYTGALLEDSDQAPAEVEHEEAAKFVRLETQPIDGDEFSYIDLTPEENDAAPYTFVVPETVPDEDEDED
ncbi:uncharacterized protein AB675_9606 [Cyphellophora attinorum]|uniref:Uncharacterized protein n=1 Tax=Cyphellophora attinorum TaxID=1664694 RepID=A0A0N1HD96_9EURO|nr:uncharacterized protein AB675_9606 [Phialophora attinorum]KPI42246.1 hypothetical protein AB675_9606 [Phialophora attinorum]